MKPVNDVRIGVIARLSGDILSAPVGRHVHQAVELAVSEIDAQGGLLLDGHRIPLSIKFADDTGSPEGAASAAHRLISVDGVSAIVGPGPSRAAIAVARVAEQAGVPMISAGSSHPELTSGNRFAFRLGAVDPVQASVLAEVAVRDLGVTRAAVLFDETDDFGRNEAVGFRDSLHKAGGAVVAFEGYLRGQESFVQELSRIRESGAEALFLPSYLADVRRQARQARELPAHWKLMGTDSLDLSFLPEEDAGSALSDLDGMYFSILWRPELPGEESRRFAEKYLAATGEKPGASAALYYEATRILCRVIEGQQSVEPEAIREGLVGLGPRTANSSGQTRFVS